MFAYSIHLRKRTTSPQTLGQDNVYALKYRMIDRENSIKNILPQWYALTMQLHILVYTDHEVTVYLLLERKNKFSINLLLNILHTINRHKIFKWSKNAAYQWCLFCAYYEKMKDGSILSQFYKVNHI